MEYSYNEFMNYFEGKSLEELKNYFPLTYKKFKQFKKNKIYLKKVEFYEKFAPKTKYKFYDDYMIYFRNGKVAPFINYNVYVKNTFQDELNFFVKYYIKKGLFKK
jgi:hypothetical protein